MERIPELFEKTKTTLKRDIGGHFLSLTSDGWTKFGTKYRSVTVHYMKNGQFRNGILALEKLITQRARDVAHFVLHVCADFSIDIPTQVLSITTDNAANMQNAQEAIGAR